MNHKGHEGHKGKAILAADERRSTQIKINREKTTRARDLEPLISGEERLLKKSRRSKREALRRIGVISKDLGARGIQHASY